MQCLVVDDDELSRFAIQHFVEKTPGLYMAGSCSQASEALAIIRKENIDVIFLDVEMPEMSGIDFLRTFDDLPQVVLVTANREHGAEAFEFNVTDFLVKPVEYARFLKSIEKVKQVSESLQIEPGAQQDIFIKKDSRLVRIGLADISHVEALADYVNIYTTAGRFTILSTMKSLEGKLPEKDFVRVHRSFIIRIDKIREIEDNAVSIGEFVIPISRSYKENLLKRLNTL